MFLTGLLSTMEPAMTGGEHVIRGGHRDKKVKGLSKGQGEVKKRKIKR